MTVEPQEAPAEEAEASAATSPTTSATGGK